MVQSGRLHTQSFLREKDKLHLPPQVRDHLLRDVDWRTRLLSSWKGNRESGGEYRIFSAQEIQDKPDLLNVIKSDASGDDGVGYANSYHHDGAKRRYGSIGWGVEGVPNSSHPMELRALQCCLEHEAVPRYPLVLLWVTDSSSAALSINKGNCRRFRSAEGFAELEAIFSISDAHGYELLAM